jgi:hypothetical protein
MFQQELEPNQIHIDIEGLREKIRQLELELEQLQSTSINNGYPHMPQTNGGKTRKHRRSIKRRNRKH